VVRAEITFVDTNVLVYAHDRSDERRQAIAMTLLEQLWADGTGRISVQVLQEFYAVSTRKLNPPMSRADAREIVALYAAWPLVLADPTLILNASRIEEVHQLSFWDGLIVEAARRAGATRLATEDLKDGAVIEGVQVENPFRPG
jgi:predicted nucleic acid-binding protein